MSTPQEDLDVPPGDALWESTAALRHAVCEEAVERLWQQHTQRIVSARKPPPALIFTLPVDANLDDLLVDNVVTRSLTPSRKLTPECIQKLRQQVQDTKDNPQFHTAGIVWSKSTSPRNQHRTVNFYYVPHHMDFPAETRRRFSTVHADERRVLEAVSYGSNPNNEDDIPRQSRRIWAVDSTLLQSDTDTQLLVQRLGELPQPPVIFVFHGVTTLPTLISERLAQRASWSLMPTLCSTLSLSTKIRELQALQQPTQLETLSRTLALGDACRHILAQQLTSTANDHVRFVQLLPFAMCGAQCVVVVPDSTLDTETADLAPSYKAWRKDTLTTFATDPSRTHSVWESTAELTANLPLFPLATCLLRDTSAASLAAAFDDVHVNRGWSMAFYTLQGASFSPMSIVRYTRDVFALVSKKKKVPGDTQKPTGAAQVASPATRQNSGTGWPFAGRLLPVSKPIPVQYTAADAAANPTASPLVMLGDAEGVGTWLRMAQLPTPPFGDRLLSYALFATDAAHAVTPDTSATESETLPRRADATPTANT